MPRWNHGKVAFPNRKRGRQSDGQVDSDDECRRWDSPCKKHELILSYKFAQQYERVRRKPKFGTYSEYSKRNHPSGRYGDFVYCTLQIEKKTKSSRGASARKLQRNLKQELFFRVQYTEH